MTVHELRINSNKFVENLDSYVESVIDDNEELLNLNRKQLKEEHKTKKDQPISPEYVAWYARLKGFRTPDLFVTGELYRSMTIEAKGNQYDIKGHTDYTKKLIDKYTGDIFGIAISMQSQAKKLTTEALSKLYRRFVFKS